MADRPHERRREARVKALTFVDVGEFSDDGVLTLLTIGRTLDLSHDGMRLELSHGVSKGTILTLDLELGEAIIQFHGRVRSSKPVEWGGNRFEMGIEFTDILPEQQELLDAFIARRN